MIHIASATVLARMPSRTDPIRETPAAGSEQGRSRDLKMVRQRLAENAGITFSTVHRFESTGTATETTKEKIKAAYAAHGVEITNGDYTGARLHLRRSQD